MLSNKFFPKLAGSKQPEVRYAPVDRASFLPYKENSASVSSDGESLSAGDTIKEDYNISYGVTKTRLCFYLLVATVLGISLGVLGCQVTWDKRAFSPKSRVKEFAPEMPLATVTFEKIPELFEAPSLESDRYWDSLVPEGKGFILIEDPEEYNLKPGILTKTAVERFSVAMYHELHCLALLRRYYWHLIDASSNGWPAESREEMVREQLGNNHPQHCFAYLAQAIMCNADLTIEWARVERDGRRYQVEGWGVPHHTCKDPKAVREWADKHRSPARPNSTHIDGSHG